ncbi:MAG: hypothetical protein E7B34_18535 [Hafnia alvei]|nr:hypothetical protein [Hafnia alvei]
MQRLILLFLSSLLLVGCVNPMTKGEVNNAVYQPLPENYQQRIKDIVLIALKDPDSAKFHFFDPKKSYSASSKHFAYVVPVGVNAKNSYGGYTGFQMSYYVYYEGRFKDVTDGVSWGGIKWSEDVK